MVVRDIGNRMKMFHILVCNYVGACSGVLPSSARSAAVSDGRQLLLDVLRGSTPTLGAGRRVCPGHKSHALVLLHGLGGACTADCTLRMRALPQPHRHTPVRPTTHFILSETIFIAE